MLEGPFAIALIASLAAALVAVCTLLYFVAYANLAFRGAESVDRFTLILLEERGQVLHNEREDEIRHAVIRLIFPLVVTVGSWWALAFAWNAHTAVPFGLNAVSDILVLAFGALAIASSIYMVGMLVYASQQARSEYQKPKRIVQARHRAAG